MVLVSAARGGYEATGMKRHVEVAVALRDAGV